MNAGAYTTGTQLRKLGEYYAKAIHDHYGLDFDILFGPAYKGIPLSVATAMAISELYGKDVRYCSNRKEVKDHGDKGILLGSPIKDGDRVVIIEDVTTSGKSMEETFPIIQAQRADRISEPHGERAGNEERSGGNPGEIRFPGQCHRKYGRSDRAPLQQRVRRKSCYR